MRLRSTIFRMANCASRRDLPPRPTIIYAPLDRPNEKLLAILFAAEALRRNGASRLVLLAPYLCYMRQDTAFHEGEAISQKVVGRLLAQRSIASSPSTRICIASPASRTSFPASKPKTCRRCRPLRNYLRKDNLDSRTIVVGPDAESLPWVRDLAGRLGLAFRGRPQDTPQRPLGRNRLCRRQGSSTGRPALLVDDIVSSGGTLIACAKALTTAGCTSIDAVVTHACSRRKWSANSPAPASADPLRAQRAASNQRDPAR